MAPLAPEKSGWIRTALGVDVATAVGGDSSAPGSRTAGPAMAKSGGKGRRKPEAFVPQPPPDNGNRPHPRDPDLAKALKALYAEIDALDKAGLDTYRVDNDGIACGEAGERAEALTDPAARDKALAAARKRATELTAHARSLRNAAKSVLGDAKDEPSDEQKSAIYKKALEEHYGIKIENPANTPNTHLDKVFDMFGAVPTEDGHQDSLKSFVFAKFDKKMGEYDPQTLSIRMGDYGKTRTDEVYKIDGKEVTVNDFNVTTLHEIGHAVDEKHGFMKNAANAGQDGCGGWRSETILSVAEAQADALIGSGKVSKGIDRDALKYVLGKALRAGDTKKPVTDLISPEDWKQIEKYMTTNCLPIRNGQDPWDKAPIAVGTRVYHEAYEGHWYSYLLKARAQSEVNGYQWRAPAEWFAELFAITWLQRAKPPSGVAANAAAFMWQD